MVCHGKISHPFGEECEFCNKVKQQWDEYVNGLVAKDLKEDKLPEFPMGVSQWAAYGKKYKYWDFFVGKIKNKLLEDIKLINTDGGGNGRRIVVEVKEIINSLE